MNWNDTFAIGIVSVFLLSVIPIVGGLMYARRERLLTHAERMKALEMGRPFADDAATARLKAACGQATASRAGDKGSLAGKCFSTAFWVAFWGFLTAAGMGGGPAGAVVATAIAASAGAIGVTAVICGTVLAVRDREPVRSSAYGKPAHDDADAFDVVSCRA